MSAYTAAIERGVVAGETSLRQIGTLIDAPRWLDDGNVTIAQTLGGKLPVSLPPGGTVAVVALPDDDSALYIALQQSFTAADVSRGLRGESGAAAAEAVALQVAVIAASDAARRG
jgi:hypothetical protein